MREVCACESPVSFGALRRTINVHKMHCHVVRDPFSNLYLQCVYEFRISSASLPIESNRCFSRQLFVDSACLHSSTDNHGDSFRSVIILNRRTCLELKHGVQVKAGTHGATLCAILHATRQLHRVSTSTIVACNVAGNAARVRASSTSATLPPTVSPWSRCMQYCVYYRNVAN